MQHTIRDLPIYYEQYGEGFPVICIHGYYVDHNLMTSALEPVFKNIKGFRRIYIDLPGMGKTPKKDWIKNSDIILDLLVEFINAILPNEQFIIFGESYGGYLSLGLICRLQQKIDGLFLICPCVIADKNLRTLPEKSTSLVTEVIDYIDNDYAYESFLDMAVVITKETWERYKKEIFVGIEIADSKFLDTLQQEGYHLSYERQFANIKYNKPSTFLLGKNDHIVGYEDTLILQENFPNGVFAIVDKAGHNLQIEQPLIFNNHLEAFIKAVCENIT